MRVRSMERDKAAVCQMCNGEGRLGNNKGNGKKQLCPKCRGTGRSSGYMTK